MITLQKTFSGLSLILVAVTALAQDAPPARAETLNVVSWDGAYLKSQILGFIRPYETETGHRINVIQYAGGISEIRQQVRSWNVSWDVVDLELFDAIRACKEGLLEPLAPDFLAPAPDGTPPQEDFLNLKSTACGIGNVAGSTVIGYHQGQFDPAPTRLEDFFDLEKFPGRRGLRKTPIGNLEWALIADGVAPKNVYRQLATERGLDRAFTKLDELKPHVDWWELGQEAVHFLESGRVAMSTVYSGRVASAVDRGEPLALLWDHQIWHYDVWGIPKNGRNAALAKDFIRYATSTRSLAAQVEYIPYGPMRRSSIQMLSPEIRQRLPTAHMETALELNAEWWSNHMDRIAPRFERWLQRPVRVPKDLPR